MLHDPGQVVEWFALAVQHHQRGELAQAEQFYRRILQSEPAHADACHYLGLIAHQTGHSEAAISLMKRALDLNPANAGYHLNLGVALKSAGKSDEAMDRFNLALALNPQSDDALNNRGNLLLEAGELESAIVSFRQAIHLNPLHTTAHYNLGNALRDQGKKLEAIASYQQAIQNNPRHLDALNNLGVQLKGQGRLDEAQGCYEQVLQLDPRHLEANKNLGNLRESQRRYEEAVGYYEQALQYNADDVDALGNLGLVLRNMGRLDLAKAKIEQALRLDPHHENACNSLGLILMDQGRLDESEQAFNRVFERKPDNALTHFNRAALWLLQGDYKRGWPEYEQRWKLAEHRPRGFTQPRWDGSPLDGRTILIHAEQGLGDTLQFIRFIPQVKALGGKIVIECPIVFHELFHGLPEIDCLLTPGEPLPEFDVYVPLMSLPFHLDTTLETIPNQVPYLQSSRQASETWRQALATCGGFRVGIVWQGSVVNASRWIRLDQFVPLTMIEGVQLLSLQMGRGPELAEVGEKMGILDLGSRFDPASLRDSAAVLANLDLLVTVDTAITHLGGALGIPVWTLLPYAADWRWLVERTDSPWYPSMRLFRQRQPCDWDDVMQRVATELRTLVSNHTNLRR